MMRWILMICLMGPTLSFANAVEFNSDVVRAESFSKKWLKTNDTPSEVIRTPLGIKVRYRQQYEGLPVLPYGEVVFQFDRSGNSKGVSDSRKRNFHIMNTRRIFQPSRKQVIWVEGTRAWHAEVEEREGIQKVFDADTGKLLYQKDRRRN